MMARNWHWARGVIVALGVIVVSGLLVTSPGRASALILVSLVPVTLVWAAWCWVGPRLLEYPPVHRWRLLRWVRNGWEAEVRAVGLARAGHAVSPLAAIELESERLTATWMLPLGATVEDVVDRCHALANFVGAEQLDVETLAPNVGELTWWHKARDPLAALPELSAPMAWDGDWSAVPFGWRPTGEIATARVAETSGTVVGGLPGGGKTAGLTALLSTIVASPSVQFMVWDGKGGGDWSWLSERAALYNADDEDRQAVSEQLERVVAEMRRRLKELPDLRGGSSLWATGGPTEDLPLLVLVIDECQTYLDATMIARSDKDSLALRQRTEAALATLVRKGRSVGIWVLLTTQKPTSDSLPTTIGANAASAIAFRVKTAEAERAVLGSAPGANDPSATDLPSVPGYAVVAREDLGREVVRFAHLPETVAAAWARQHAHLVKPLPLTAVCEESDQPAAAGPNERKS